MDITYGVDHYKYSDQTANNGFHNTVTTPLVVGSAHPATAANVPKLYSMQDTANIGVIQYSRGGNNAVPSPITFIQSPSTATVINNGAFANVLDLAGTARAIIKGYAANFNSVNATKAAESAIYWDGTNMYLRPTASINFGFVNSGSIIRLFNNTGSAMNDVYWVLQIMRVQV